MLGGCGGYECGTAPVLVSDLTGIIAIAASPSGAHSLALKNDGKLWAWGDDLYAELGNGGSGSLSTLPVQVF
jgi:alpha-tubulin suppressor-like RCC1 family protein